ncbi:MAG: rRNA maturation RNase YbeY [Desulfobacter sp.]|nr:rRNA maturation RNase YbeY [Desulfobacter sp.]
MAVLIDNRQTKHRLHLDKIRQTAQDILNALDCPDGELSILLVDDPQIEILNTKYLNRRKPTNVIAFPMQEGKLSNISPTILGDVAVSIDTAAKEGEEAGIGMEKRLTELLLHGILHLLGYDHENNEQEAEEMERKSAALLKQF